jgi:hypothetical protein
MTERKRKLMMTGSKRCVRYRTDLPLPEMRFNSALRLEHATTMASYVGAHPDFSVRERSELEAVVKTHPAGQFYTRGYGVPGRRAQPVCRKGSMLPPDQPVLLGAHQDTFSLPAGQLTTLASRPP